MKRLLVSSVFVALVVAACSQSADAQLFRRSRRNFSNGYYSGYNNGWYGGHYANRFPSPNSNYAVPTYRTGGYQSGGYQSGVAAPSAVPRATNLSPTAPLLGPDETVISGANVRADGAAAAGNRVSEPRVPGPAGSTSPNVGATANP